MKTIKLENFNGPEVSAFAFGTSQKPFENGVDCSKLLDAVIESGINYIDTARCYQKAEKTIGNWLSKRNIRENIVIQSKGGLDNIIGFRRIKKSCIAKDLEKSLKALQTDYIDIYLLHRDDERVKVSTIVEFMNDFIKEGKIKAWGVSNWKIDRILKANEYAKENRLIGIAVSEPQFSLVNTIKEPWPRCYSVSGSEKSEEIELYKKHNITMVPYSVLARGLLTGKVKSTDDIGYIKHNMDYFAKKAYLNQENIKTLSKLEQIARNNDISVPNVVLSYMVNNLENIIPIIATSKIDRLKNLVLSSKIKLSKNDIEILKS